MKKLRKKISRKTAVKPPARVRKPPARVRRERGHWISDRELAGLRENLREAQETLDAIRSGEVDAVVVNGAKGSQIYSLTGAEQPYRIYVERMQEGAVTASDEGLVLYCNQRFADMVQLPLERVIGSKMPGHLEMGAWQKISSVFDGKEDVIKHTCALVRVSGDALPIHLAASRLPIEDQSVMCLVVTDLTHQKRHEEMRVAKELAEKASTAKDEFLAALSHELRTPLTPVLMAAVAMENAAGLPKDTRESLAMIRRNVELEVQLIDDLLDLTRIAQGKMELNVSPMDFHTVIRHAVDICRPDIAAKGQKFTLALDARYHRAAGDPVRIQQAVWNLVRNAAKFTPEGGSIVVRTENPAPEKISVEVEDTGMGFQPGFETKLFQTFEQGGRHITRQFGGLGLGMRITRSIVETHGGAIWARSPGVGKGATFTFQVPLRPARSASGETGGAPPARVPRVSGKRILLVEDHQDTRNTLALLLRKHQHQIEAVGTAEEALSAANKQRFDLVISDIGLPDQSGLELMAQLRDRYGLKGIGLSGFGMREDVAKGLAAGFACHLTKPVQFDRLTQVIAEITGST